MRKVCFLDRDGVINQKMPDHAYVLRPEQFVLNAGILPVLAHMRQSNFDVIVITNQRGIARGLMTESDLTEVHARMRELLSQYGFDFLDILYCPHDTGTCRCRKPGSGMLEEACRRYEIDIASSVLISDSSADVQMGLRFGILSSVLVPSDNPESSLHSLVLSKPA